MQRLLACLNFTLESEDLSFCYKPKKWFLWTMAAAQAVEKHGDEWGLTWYFLWGIYTSIPTQTHSQNSLAVAEAPNEFDGKSVETEATTWSEFPNEVKPL